MNILTICLIPVIAIFIFLWGREVGENKNNKREEALWRHCCWLANTAEIMLKTYGGGGINEEFIQGHVDCNIKDFDDVPLKAKDRRLLQEQMTVMAELWRKIYPSSCIWVEVKSLVDE